MFKRIDHVEIVTARQDETVSVLHRRAGFPGKGARPHPTPGRHGAEPGLSRPRRHRRRADVVGRRAGRPEPQQEHLGYRMIALEVDDMKRPPNT